MNFKHVKTCVTLLLRRGKCGVTSVCNVITPERVQSCKAVLSKFKIQLLEVLINTDSHTATSRDQ